MIYVITSLMATYSIRLYAPQFNLRVPLLDMEQTQNRSKSTGCGFQGPQEKKCILPEVCISKFKNL